MSFTKHERERLRDILKRAYRGKENLELGELRWDDLRDSLRSADTIQPMPRFLMVFAQFVWQIAPVVSLLILALTGVLLALDLTSGYDVFQLLLNGKEEFTLSQMLGI